MSVALVTGAAGAMGQAIAVRLATENHQDLILIDISERVGEVAGRMLEHGVSATACVADVSTVEGALLVLGAVERSGEQVSVLVNNAGINRDGRASKLTEADFRAVVRV